MTKELLIMLAAELPERDILSRLKDAIEDKLMLESEEADDEIDMLCTLYMINRKTNGTQEGAKKIIKDMDNFEKLKDLQKRTN